jgi:hypothetical protein
MADGDWELLLSRIHNKTCTPFLGAGASAHVLPTGTDLAKQWADELRYPLPVQGDLAQVAQYMAITRDDPFPKERVSELCRKIHPAEALQRGDSYDIISSLDLPVYITTNYDNLLIHALRNNGKTPQALLCPWRNSLYGLVGETYMYEPTPKKPVVYYLHGSADVPRSIVITEDDYLDFIVWVTQKWQEQSDVSRISPFVIDALGTNSLLFIGYSQKDWSFRVLMRCIRQAGNNLGARHIAVQLPLSKDATAKDQERIEDYVTRYFAKIQGNPVTIYWGTADEFLQDLQKHLEEAEGS